MLEIEKLLLRLRAMKASRAVVAHAFNPSVWEAEAIYLCEFKASLVHMVISRKAKAIQGKLVSNTHTQGRWGMMTDGQEKATCVTTTS